MANYNKSFNFRNGVQVDNDNFIVNANGLVGIGTTIPKDYLLNVYGDVRVTGFVTTKSLNVSELNIGIATVTSLNVGNISISSGIITATSGIVTYYGDGSNLANLPTSQWIDVDPGPFVSSIYAAGNVGIITTFPSFALQIGGNPDVSNGIGINSVGEIYASGIITAASFSGSGSLLSNINANNISSGTLNASRLPVIPNQNLPSNISVSGIITAQTRFVGNVTGNVNSSGVSTFSGGIIGNVTGNVNSSGVSTFSGGIIGNVTGNVNSSGVSTFSGGILGNVTGNLVGIASTARNLTSDARVNIQHLESQTSTIGVSTISTRLRVSGNIGVNTDSPQADIHIVNSTNTSLHLTGNESTITLGRSLSKDQNTGGLKFGNTSGIYPYSDTRTLDIVNYDTGNLNYYLHYGPAGIGTGNFNWLYGPDSSNPLMTLTYQGNLGIGVTNPTNRLQVSGIVSVTSLVTGNITANGNVNSSGNIVAIGAGTSTSVQTLYVYGGKNQILNSDGTEIFASANVNNTSGVSTFFDINVTNNVIVDGNIGIGTTNPLYPIQIGNDGGDIENSVVISQYGIGLGTDISNSEFFLDALGKDSVFGAVSIGSTEDKTKVGGGNGFRVFYVKGLSEFDGNVGVGTTNPTSALTVQGDTRITGVTTSQGGFTSGIGVTDPVQITVSGNILTFTVVGVGSTSLTLY
jgi:hypothetical protein